MEGRWLRRGERGQGRGDGRPSMVLPCGWFISPRRREATKTRALTHGGTPWLSGKARGAGQHRRASEACRKSREPTHDVHAGRRPISVHLWFHFFLEPIHPAAARGTTSTTVSARQSKSGQPHVATTTRTGSNGAKFRCRNLMHQNGHRLRHAERKSVARTPCTRTAHCSSGSERHERTNRSPTTGRPNLRHRLNRGSRETNDAKRDAIETRPSNCLSPGPPAHFPAACGGPLQ